MIKRLELMKKAEENIEDHLEDLSEPYRELLNERVSEDIIKEINLEILVLDLAYDRETKDYFCAKITDPESGKCYPDIKANFKDEMKKHLIKRVDEIENPILLARYNDVLWSIYNCYEYTNGAIKGYIDSSRILCENECEWAKEIYLDRAMQIAIKIKDKDHISNVLRVYKEVLANLKETEKYKVMVEVINSLFNYYESLTEVERKFINESILYLEEINKIAFDQNEHELQRLSLKALVNIYSAEKNLQLKSKFSIEIAKSFEYEATCIENEHASIKLYERSMKVYMLNGVNSKVDELKVKIRKMRERAFAKMSKNEIKITMSTDKDTDYLSIYESIGNPNEFLNYICKDARLIPKWETAVNNAQWIMNNSILKLSTFEEVKDGLVIKKVSEEKEKLMNIAAKQFKVEYGKTIITKFCSIIEIFKKKFNKPEEAMINFISQSDLIQKDKMKIIEIGIRKYFEKDYISTCHLLIFQIEDILRNIMKKLELPTFLYRNDEMSESLLNACIEKLSDELFDDNFTKLLSIFLIDKSGDNFRNEIAHGIAEVTKMNQVNASLLIYFHLFLSNIYLREIYL